MRGILLRIETNLSIYNVYLTLVTLMKYGKMEVQQVLWAVLAQACRRMIIMTVNKLFHARHS